MPNLHYKTAWRPHHVILNLINLATKCIKDMAYSENLLDTRNDKQKFWHFCRLRRYVYLNKIYRFLNTRNLHPIINICHKLWMLFYCSWLSSRFSLLNTQGIFHLWTFAEKPSVDSNLLIRLDACARYYDHKVTKEN